MECHAWMVTIPLGNKKHVASLGKQSVTKRVKDICVPYKNEYFLNPGHPATKEYLMRLVREVVERYDIDGVHFDYLRYPENAPLFPDKYDFRRYSKGRTLDQWRRDNISEIVRYIYKGVKAMKPWVKVSTCPVGKYRDTSRYSSRGWNAFYTVYQDPQGWLGEGIQDQIYPMMYFQETVSILSRSTGRNRATDDRLFRGWASISSIPTKGSGHATKWIVRLISSVIRKWQEKGITVSSI